MTRRMSAPFFPARVEGGTSISSTPKSCSRRGASRNRDQSQYALRNTTLPFSSRRSIAGCRSKEAALIPVLVTRFSKSMNRAIRRSESATILSALVARGVVEGLAPGVALALDGVGRSAVAVAHDAAVAGQAASLAVHRPRGPECHRPGRSPTLERLRPSLLLRHVFHAYAQTTTDPPGRRSREADQSFATSTLASKEACPAEKAKRSTASAGMAAWPEVRRLSPSHPSRIHTVPGGIFEVTRARACISPRSL